MLKQSALPSKKGLTCQQKVPTVSGISERTFAAGLVWVEPTEGGAGRFSSREVEGVAQWPQTCHRTANVCRSQRVCGHESVAVAVQHHVLRLEATAILTAIQHLRAASMVIRAC